MKIRLKGAACVERQRARLEEERAAGEERMGAG